jgi:hypothetical protein
MLRKRLCFVGMGVLVVMVQLAMGGSGVKLTYRHQHPQRRVGGAHHSNHKRDLVEGEVEPVTVDSVVPLLDGLGQFNATTARGAVLTVGGNRTGSLPTPTVQEQPVLMTDGVVDSIVESSAAAAIDSLEQPPPSPSTTNNVDAVVNAVEPAASEEAIVNDGVATEVSTAAAADADVEVGTTTTNDTIIEAAEAPPTTAAAVEAEVAVGTTASNDIIEAEEAPPTTAADAVEAEVVGSTTAADKAEAEEEEVSTTATSSSEAEEVGGANKNTTTGEEPVVTGEEEGVAPTPVVEASAVVDTKVVVSDSTTSSPVKEKKEEGVLLHASNMHCTIVPNDGASSSVTPNAPRWIVSCFDVPKNVIDQIVFVEERDCRISNGLRECSTVLE